jgi:hypothetical protein
VAISATHVLLATYSHFGYTCARELQPIYLMNWLENATQTIAKQVPELAASSKYVCERLASLLLARLPYYAGLNLIQELNDHAPPLLRPNMNPRGEASIGYPDFVDRALQAIAFSSMDDPTFENRLDEIARRVADLFLYSMAKNLPETSAQLLERNLPTELLYRMNLMRRARDESRAA